MKFNFKKIENPVESNSYFIVNKLQFDEGIINILSKDGNDILEYNSEGFPTWISSFTNTSHNTVQLSEFPSLQIPIRVIDEFKVNKKFINSDNHKLSHFHLFKLILSKVDNEVYLLPKSVRTMIYSVFDSNKKYQGDFTLLDTGFGIGNCQVNPQFTLDIQSDVDKSILHRFQNQYDQAYWKFYGPEKELEQATKQLDEYKKKIKDKTDTFKGKWGYLF
jgi:hypothetical protein